MNDSLLKMLLENINNNIDILRKEHNVKIENINNDIYKNIGELKEDIKTLSVKIDEVKINYITKDNCKKQREDNIDALEIKKQEISLKKLTIITGATSAAIASIIGLLSKIIS